MINLNNNCLYITHFSKVYNIVKKCERILSESIVKLLNEPKIYIFQ